LKIKLFLKHFTIIIAFLVCTPLYLVGQSTEEQRISAIEQQLRLLSAEDPDLIADVNISTKSISIQDYVRLLAKTAEINISVDPSLPYEVAAHFSDEEPVHIIMHLVKRFDLDATITGSIIYLTQADPENDIPAPKIYSVSYNGFNDALSYDLELDTLSTVIKSITDQSNKNIILQQGIRDQLISGYVKDLPFREAIGNLAYSNGLVSEEMGDGTFILTTPNQDQTVQENIGQLNQPLPPYRPKSLGVTFNYQFGESPKGEKLITIEATKTPILDLIKPIADEYGIDYVFLAELVGEATIKADNITLDEYLTRVLDATEFSYTKKNGIYVFSQRENIMVNDIHLFQFQERSVDPLLGILSNKTQQINAGGVSRNNNSNNRNQQLSNNQNNFQPQIFGNQNPQINGNRSSISYFNDSPVTNIDFSGVNMTSIPEYNSVLLSGPKSAVEDVKFLLTQLDKRVPLVLLELIVVDVRKGHNVTAGVRSAGIGTQPTQTQGDLFNGGFALGANSINSLLNILEGIGSINLGRVGPNFFAGLVALENNENIKIRNTTRLSTLNSHVAEFTFGEREYYINEQVTSIPSINGVQIIENRQYLPIDANTSLKIRPMVSGDEFVTLTIEFSESQFDLNGRLDLQAPPPTDDRTFTSLIRVKDQEMIVLGGIEREEKSDTGEGVPFLARVPVIKWLFGNRNKTKSKEKQIVFIRPSIVY